MSVSAGRSPLLNVFKTGAVLVFKSDASGRNLQAMHDGDVQGKGEEGQIAQFKVHVRGPQVVSLQSMHDPSHWLRIYKNDLNAKGGDGGPHTLFKLEEHNERIVFESVRYPGLHAGILENGTAKKPSDTGTGKHAQFFPKVIHEVKEKITSGTYKFENILVHGNIVVLESVASGKSLRVFDNAEIDGTGGTGALAQFIVHVVGYNTIKLQCMKHRERWLKIKKNKLAVGKGGYPSELMVDSENGNLVLGSVKYPGFHVGVLENGDVKKPNLTGDGKHGQFQVKVIKEQSEYYRAGTNLLERTLHHGNRVILHSKASRKTLRIRNDRVEGTGGEGYLAQFIVHVRAPGVVALQNVHEPKRYLVIKPEELTYGHGNSKSNLKVKVRDDNGEFLLFESEDHPGNHVGVLPNGDVKAPQSTGEGTHGQFTPKVIDESPFSRRD